MTVDTSALSEQFWTLVFEHAKVSNIEHSHQVHSPELAKQAVARRFEWLTDGTLQLARVVLSHAIDPMQSGAAKVGAFQAAYSAIVRSVPEAMRLQLLRDMRAGLEQVTKAELAAASPGKDAPVSTSDFMAGLERNETDQRARDIGDGLLVPSATLAARLKMTPQGLHTAVKAKRIFTLQGPSGEQVYPAFFADPKQDRKMLEKISKALGDLPGAAKWDFFMSARVSLGKQTPLEALAKGKFEAVMAAASAFAQE